MLAELRGPDRDDVSKPARTRKLPSCSMRVPAAQTAFMRRCGRRFAMAVHAPLAAAFSALLLLRVANSQPVSSMLKSCVRANSCTHGRHCHGMLQLHRSVSFR